MVDLRRAFLSKGFLIGSIITFTALYLASLTEIGHGSEALYSFMYAFGYNNSDILIRLAATFAYSSSFCFDLNTRMSNFIVIRTSTGKYAISKYISASLSGGISVCLGVFLFLIFLNTNVPIKIINTGEYLLPAFKQLLIANNIKLYFLCVFLVIFMNGAFWSCLGMSISSFLPNKYIAYTSPFITAFVFIELVVSLKLPPWLNIVSIGICHFDFGGVYKTLLITVGVFITLIAICSFIFIINVKRRIAND